MYVDKIIQVKESLGLREKSLTALEKKRANYTLLVTEFNVR